MLLRLITFLANEYSNNTNSTSHAEGNKFSDMIFGLKVSQPTLVSPLTDRRSNECATYVIIQQRFTSYFIESNAHLFMNDVDLTEGEITHRGHASRRHCVLFSQQ